MADVAEDRYVIHAAARDGKASLVESLLQANPNLAARKDDDGRVPLHWAVSSNHKDIVLLLSQRRNFDPDVQDDSGWTPLMIAASLKDGDEVVALLLQRGADVNQKNFNGQTALHFVASKNNLDVARALFDNKQAATAAVRDRRGQLPIHRAAAVGSVPMITLLLKHRSPLDAIDSAGYTALHHAIAEGHGDAAVTLLKEGADTSKRDSDGFLAIDLAPDKEVRKYIERMAEQEGIELG